MINDTYVDLLLPPFCLSQLLGYVYLLAATMIAGRIRDTLYRNTVMR